MRGFLPLLLCIACGTAQAGSLQSLAEAYVESGHTPAVALARLGPDGVETAFAGDIALDPELLFEIGSVTKVFTAVLLADLTQRGVVSLDSTLGGLYPDAYTLDPAVAAITLRELADHTSGLPRLPQDPASIMRGLFNLGDPYAGTTQEGLFNAVAALDADAVARRGEFAYSNLGVALLGRLLEVAAGGSYERLVEDRVWLPLGLDGMAFTNEVLGARPLARPHRENGTTARHWRMDAYNPAGGMVAGLGHMIRFLQAAMSDVPGPMAETVEQGLGWAQTERDGVDVVWHNGRTGGYYAFVGFVPGQQRGVVLLSNASHAGDAFAMDMLMGEPEVPRPGTGWIMIGFTVLFTLMAPLLLWPTATQPASRLHVFDAVASGVMLLALTHRLGTWMVVPVVFWYAVVAGSLALAAMALTRSRGIAWVPPGRPWRTAGNGFSAALSAILAYWALFRL